MIHLKIADKRLNGAVYTTLREKEDSRFHRLSQEIRSTRLPPLCAFLQDSIKVKNQFDTTDQKIFDTVFCTFLNKKFVSYLLEFGFNESEILSLFKRERPTRKEIKESRYGFFLYYTLSDPLIFLLSLKGNGIEIRKNFRIDLALPQIMLEHMMRKLREQGVLRELSPFTLDLSVDFRGFFVFSFRAGPSKPRIIKNIPLLDIDAFNAFASDLKAFGDSVRSHEIFLKTGASWEQNKLYFDFKGRGVVLYFRRDDVVRYEINLSSIRSFLHLKPLLPELFKPHVLILDKKQQIYHNLTRSGVLLYVSDFQENGALVSFLNPHQTGFYNPDVVHLFVPYEELFETIETLKQFCSEAKNYFISEKALQVAAVELKAPNQEIEGFEAVYLTLFIKELGLDEDQCRLFLSLMHPESLLPFVGYPKEKEQRAPANKLLSSYVSHILKNVCDRLGVESLIGKERLDHEGLNNYSDLFSSIIDSSRLCYQGVLEDLNFLYRMLNETKATSQDSIDLALSQKKEEVIYTLAANSLNPQSAHEPNAFKQLLETLEPYRPMSSRSSYPTYVLPVQFPVGGVHDMYRASAYFGSFQFDEAIVDSFFVRFSPARLALDFTQDSSLIDDASLLLHLQSFAAKMLSKDSHFRNVSEGRKTIEKQVERDRMITTYLLGLDYVKEEEDLLLPLRHERSFLAAFFDLGHFGMHSSTFYQISMVESSEILKNDTLGAYLLRPSSFFYKQLTISFLGAQGVQHYRLTTQQTSFFQSGKLDIPSVLSAHSSQLTPYLHEVSPCKVSEICLKLRQK